MPRVAAAKKVDAAEGSGRWGKEDWINLAIEALVSEGIDQVKVQVMAKKLGVSRSSFYFFFDSIQALQEELLETWLKRNTGSIIERAMRPAPTVTKAVLNVFECWVDKALFDPQLDNAVRYWARRDNHVRDVVEAADDQRVSAITRMFMRYGIAEEEALTRARVMYFMQIGHYALEHRESLESRLTHVRSYVLTFTGVEPATAEVDAFVRLATAAARS